MRNFACVQLFFHVLSGYIYLRCIKREAHSHGAYQDFVREVGAPNLLLTDNARTETGKRWTKTSRNNITKQIATAPYNQQQNQAERKIGNLKSRVLVTLRKANAPIEFWCYCLVWIADCLNHTAQQHLDWRTPTELLNGQTPDISVFRFSFFEPVWYYEPTAKYPEPNFLPGFFVGIAWNHGDAFTYRIWTCPKGNYKGGQELIRNIVKSRSGGETWTLDEVQPAFDFTSKKRKRKRKRNSSIEEDPAPVDVVPHTPTVERDNDGRRRVSFGTRQATLNLPQSLSVVEGTDSEELGGKKKTVLLLPTFQIKIVIKHLHWNPSLVQKW